ncbi:sodium- and chloride-dependent glycine transporter 2 [Trichonephila clavipes]|uniref:Sodium- and chloride-dependent glycine transporter 2 n=1 Tax=Trichonephila clavipes TaxID=2585209 RepID=A0A8X6WIU9_TRICX|nr:sodium- and chloride-dependent glycine transporter 2 [Trichonephila clavipes]
MLLYREHFGEVVVSHSKVTNIMTNQTRTSAFLIPYLLMLLLAGKPLYFMELAFGQFAGLGPLAIWNCLPIAKGIGYAMVTISLVICIYYNVIVCYTVFYIASTFQTTVPWATCPAYPHNVTRCHVRNQEEAFISKLGWGDFKFPDLDALMSMSIT